MPRFRYVTLCMLCLQVGCASERSRRVAVEVESLHVLGAKTRHALAIKRKIATTQTQRALQGLLEGVPILGLIDTLTVEYGRYDSAVLQRDLDRIERYYRARGFYQAKVLAGRVIATEAGKRRVEIVVHEGAPVRLARVRLKFAGDKPHYVAEAAITRAVEAYGKGALKERLKTAASDGPAFDEDRYESLKVRLKRLLREKGYARANVLGQVRIDQDLRRADVAIEVVAGPRCVFGTVSIEGNGEVPVAAVRDAIAFQSGELFAQSKLERSRRALQELQVFAVVKVKETLRKSKPNPDGALPVDIAIVLRKTQLRSFRAGGGAEIGAQLEAHGVVAWEDRNFLGGLRHFSVELRPGLVFFPTRADTLFTQPPTRVLPEAALRLGLIQPRFIERKIKLRFASSINIFAPQNAPVVDPIPSDFNVVGYREVEGALGLSRPFKLPLADSRLRLQLGYRLRFDDPFSYNLPAPPDGYKSVLIPYMESSVSWDNRRDKEGALSASRPHDGFLLSLGAQFAGGALGGDADDVRLKPELRVFVGFNDTVSLAGRWLVGLLFPRNYGSYLTTVGDADDAGRARDLQLLSFRAFYSGGPYSNRGYGLREVGPYATVPYLSQSAPSSDLLPIGGVGLWELSTELRFVLQPNLNLVLFVDASDVVRSLGGFRLTHPHISPGLGLRIFTPVGPLRFDLASPVPYMQRLGSRYLEPEEGGPEQGEDARFPLQFSLAIGEAF